MDDTANALVTAMKR